MSIKFDVFVKQVAKKDNSGTFPVYSTRNANGVKFKIKFTQDVPTNIYKSLTKPFTVVVPEKKANISSKYRTTNSGNRIIEHFIYIEEVIEILPYEREALTMEDFNSYKREDNDDYEELISDDDINRENDLPY